MHDPETRNERGVVVDSPSYNPPTSTHQPNEAQTDHSPTELTERTWLTRLRDVTPALIGDALLRYANTRLIVSRLRRLRRRRRRDIDGYLLPSVVVVCHFELIKSVYTYHGLCRILNIFFYESIDLVAMKMS